MTLRGILLAFALLFALAAPAGAQTQPETPAASAPSPNDVQELLRILGDPRVVEWLRQNAAGQPPPPEQARQLTLMAEIEARLMAARARIAELGRAWSNFPLVPEVLAAAWRSELGVGQALRSLTYVLIFLFAGSGLEWLFWQYFHPLLLRIEHRRPVTLAQRVAGAASRLLLQATALAIFAVASIGLFLAFAWPPFLERIVVNLLLAVIMLRILALFVRFVLAPRNQELRLAPLDTSLARRVQRWIMIVGGALIGAVVVSDTLAELARTESGSADARAAALAVATALGALTVAVVLAAVWRLAGAFAIAYPPKAARRRFEPPVHRIAPIAFSVLAVVVFVLWVFDATELMWTLLVAGLFLPASRLVRTMVDHLFDRAEGVAVAEDGAAAAPTASSQPQSVYRPIARRLARFVLAAIALAVIAAAWGANILTLSTSPSIAGRMVKVAIDIVAALLIADIVWVWARTAIDRRMAGYVPPPAGEPPGPEARMATLLPLLRNMLMVTMIVLVALTVLSSLGVNIAPLLAGAGIAGVAIGFGTQSLVRDIVSGIFFLLDDAFRVGEYIEIGDLRGTVESMSLRSMRVRHHRGAVHTIPFGELTSLTNYSRDWVIMKLEFRVPFDTDLRLVKKIIKQIGAELVADPNYGHQIIETLKSQGVRRMEEFNMVVGVKFMTKPGAQWVIRRDAYQKVRDAFGKHGIDFAQRNVKVEVLGDRPLPDDVRKAIAGVAQEAVEQRAPARAAADEP